MQQRDVEAAFLIIKDSVLHGPEDINPEAMSQALSVVCQLCVDINRIADAVELIYKQGHSK